MSVASIPVDLANPGQVFACLGFVEAAEVLLRKAEGGFDWGPGDVRDPGAARFRFAAEGGENPAARVLRFLEEATVKVLAPAGSTNRMRAGWKIETVSCDSNVFPFPDPKSPATLPARLQDGAGQSIVLDHWGDTRRDNVKFWAGAGGYPGAALARDALDLVRGRAVDCADDPFALAAPQSGSFRFDWRRDYVPIDAGFSPNAHRKLVMQGYPIVELLAAIGLTHARPLRRSKLEYSYGVPGLVGADLHDVIILRAALGACQPPFPGMPFRRFSMQLDWPGQENQARCITNVTEETSSS